MFGLAIGDAIGTTLEFSARNTSALLTDMMGGGPFGLKKGQWTDDTSMALCLAESLVQCGENNPADQMSRYIRWWKQAHLSSTGRCFDIGNTIREALIRFVETGNPIAGSEDPQSAGNGSLMRLAPIPLAFRAADTTLAVEMAALSSKTTHAAREAVDACRLMTILMRRALAGESKDDVLDEDAWGQSLALSAPPLAPRIREIAMGSYKAKPIMQIYGSGYVVNCLEAALWAFYKNDNYKDAVLAAANLGDDADTTAAVCGQLAGAFYGITAIPESWVEQVYFAPMIAELALGLFRLSQTLR